MERNAERQLRLEIAKQHRLLAQLEEQLAATLVEPQRAPTAEQVASRVRRKIGAKR